jgi:hypothetical protein
MTDSEQGFIRSLLQECVNAHVLDGDGRGSSFHGRCDLLRDSIFCIIGESVDVEVVPDLGMVRINNTIVITL